MDGLARFVRSDVGQLYSRVCERYGLDPAVSIEDEVLAFNLRAALILTEQQPVEAESPPERGGQIVTDLERQIRAARGY